MKKYISICLFNHVIPKGLTFLLSNEFSSALMISTKFHSLQTTRFFFFTHLFYLNFTLGIWGIDNTAKASRVAAVSASTLSVVHYQGCQWSSPKLDVLGQRLMSPPLGVRPIRIHGQALDVKATFMAIGTPGDHSQGVVFLSGWKFISREPRRAP